MGESLVFISGASSGIGLALAKSVPWASARIFDLSRRGSPDCSHVKVDLADPAGWEGAAELFEAELRDYRGERAVFVHSAGTLEPMGFAGEVDPRGYTRQVLLNSAAPQVLGAAFLRAARTCHAPCHLVMISSGAAKSVHQGWSAYGAGKAALDQWVRIAGSEQERRGGRCRILAVAPGVVETEMQRQIRAMHETAFPEVEYFKELQAEGVLRDPADAARDIWKCLARGLPNGAVVDLRDLAG